MLNIYQYKGCISVRCCLLLHSICVLQLEPTRLYFSGKFVFFILLFVHYYGRFASFIIKNFNNFNFFSQEAHSPDFLQPLAAVLQPPILPAIIWAVDATVSLLLAVGQPLVFRLAAKRMIVLPTKTQFLSMLSMRSPMMATALLGNTGMNKKEL